MSTKTTPRFQPGDVAYVNGDRCEVIAYVYLNRPAYRVRFTRDHVSGSREMLIDAVFVTAQPKGKKWHRQ